LQRFPERHRPLERLAFDIFHDKVIRTHVVERADVRMIQCRDGQGFAREAVAEAVAALFYGDGAVEPRVARFLHLAHAACAKGREYFIRAEFGSAN
jgi:hypothetical protein